jgi:serine/threonine-protein kinase
VPHEVEELVFDTLAKDPEGRPQTARELADRFDTALSRAQAKAEARASHQGLKVGTLPGGSHPGMRSPVPDRPSSHDRPSPLHHPTPPEAPAPTTPTSRDEAALPFHMEAWMPERIAIVKLRGFVHDAGGEVVESVPGLIKVRLGGRKASTSGPFSWLGLRKSSAPIDVELHLHHLDPAKDNQLTVHVLFRPSHPALLTDRIWRQRCTQVFIELRAYLMGRSPE